MQLPITGDDTSQGTSGELCGACAEGTLLDGKSQWAARRSVRRYRPELISRELVDQLLAAAVSAPSAHNRQPWRFAVMERGPTTTALACSMGERLRGDRHRDGDRKADIDADVERSHARISGAAAVIIVCLSMEDMDLYSDPVRSGNEYLMAVQSVAMAGQNLLLAAQVAGLGACWLCAPLFCPDAVRESIGLPTHWEPQGMITLGYPANTGRPFIRKSLSEVTVRLGWGS